MRTLLTSTALSLLSSIVSAALSSLLSKPIWLVGSYVQLSLHENPGVAFSLTLPPVLQSGLIAGALLAVLVVAIRSKKSREQSLAFGMILGGGCANVIDRLIDGRVTDIFLIGTFPVFNLADLFICIGVGVLLVERRRKNHS